ncbi:MAG: hypothetical protein COX02_00610 [Candidatus Vogelbacteria bacterium CG22_combo_CG10-13_8_21_14_all_37_9]|uniref:histidine kinase n=1 Tax=Candidatus Vogelbacteria bacterium CG22_combo_CG10-13_8_21_14_all_37_9 TaxID=1975046 RepID=A0A2H0BL26_9BACT|nr:MAG: hypothetical protein BK005_02205 [bacterium CG10_37_50]PIP58383.1 MAG: hypothetical protein COX02_00610 [Candidatus Vogelbacteria bacterium CG22_combo_CG10-13_8_21_14_all_37_9]
MFKRFFTYQILANLARLAISLLVLVSLIRVIFSPTRFDQVINISLLVLVLIVAGFLWQFLIWTARQQKKLAEVLRLRSKFIDLASFQLRSPVSAIMTALSFWREGLVEKLPAPEKLEFINNLYQRGQQLGQVIRDVLQASEFDTEKITFADKHLSLLDVAVVAEQIKNNFTEAASAKGLKLLFKNEAKQTTVKSFADYLSEAISNLVDNAIRYTKTGQVEIRLSNESKILVLEVIDTGIGIPPADQAELFSRFSRGSNTGDLPADGSGLGLYLAKEIVEAHKGGQISFTSQLGRGTTFSIYLPLAK